MQQYMLVRTHSMASDLLTMEVMVQLQNPASRILVGALLFGVL